MDGRNPSPPWMVESLWIMLNNGINMDKPSINWCRISQPSTILSNSRSKNEISSESRWNGDTTNQLYYATVVSWNLSRATGTRGSIAIESRDTPKI